MKRVNLIVVLNKEGTHVLMCHRQKNPYKGLYNFVGGKVDKHEIDLEAAYRELQEETGIDKQAITIEPLFFTTYFKDGIELQVFYGQLQSDVVLKEEANPLIWIDFNGNFLENNYAGDGNVSHIVACIKENIHATWE